MTLFPIDDMPEGPAHLWPGPIDDLRERVQRFASYELVDFLDTLDEPDWVLLDDIRRMRDLLQKCILYAAKENRAKLESARSGVAAAPPPGVEPAAGSGG